MKINSKWQFLSYFMVLSLLTACDNSLPSQRSEAMVLEGNTMGTSWRVSLANVDSTRRDALQKAVQQQLDSDDHELSTWKRDSVLSLFNQYRGSEPQPVSNNMADIITLSLRIGQQTAGAMDITIGPLVNLWGFGPDKQPLKTPCQQQIDAARALTGLSPPRSPAPSPPSSPSSFSSVPSPSSSPFSFSSVPSPLPSLPYHDQNTQIFSNNTILNNILPIEQFDQQIINLPQPTNDVSSFLPSFSYPLSPPNDDITNNNFNLLALDVGEIEKILGL